MAKELSCSVSLCNNTSKRIKEKGERILFFSFPTNFEVKKEWIIRCHRDSGFDVETAKVCSKHFTVDDYDDKVKAKLLGYQPKILKDTAVPSLELHPALSDAIREFEQCKKVKERKELVEKLLQQHSAINKTQVDLRKNDVKNNNPNKYSKKNEPVRTVLEKQYIIVPMPPKGSTEKESPETKSSLEVETLRRTVQELEQRNTELERDLEASNTAQRELRLKLSESETNREVLESQIAVLETLLKESKGDFDLRWEAVGEMERHLRSMPEEIAGNVHLLEKTVAFIASKILSLGIDINLIEAFCKSRKSSEGPSNCMTSTKRSLDDAPIELNKKIKEEVL